MIKMIHQQKKIMNRLIKINLQINLALKVDQEEQLNGAPKLHINQNFFPLSTGFYWILYRKCDLRKSLIFFAEQKCDIAIALINW